MALKTDGVPLNHSKKRLWRCGVLALGMRNSNVVKPGCLAPSSMIILLADGVLSGTMTYAKIETMQVSEMIQSATTAEGFFRSRLMMLLCVSFFNFVYRVPRFDNF